MESSVGSRKLSGPVGESPEGLPVCPSGRAVHSLRGCVWARGRWHPCRCLQELEDGVPTEEKFDAVMEWAPESAVEIARMMEGRP